MEEKTPKKFKESKFYKEFIKPNLPKTRKEVVGYIMIILIVITLGLISVNQYLAIQHKATLILNPCALCEDFQEKMRINSQIGGTELLKNIEGGVIKVEENPYNLNP